MLKKKMAAGVVALAMFSTLGLAACNDGGSASPTKTLTMYIRDRIVDPTFGSLGQGDAASVCLFLITFGFIIASQSLQRKAEES